MADRMTTTWHVDPDDLDAYASGRGGDVVAGSIEAHLLGCDRCRGALATLAPAPDVGWAALARRIDAAPTSRVEALAVRMGLDPSDARLLAPTRSFRWAWVLGVALALLSAAAVARFDVAGARSLGRLVFLTLAPLVPLVAVVGALSHGVEPTPDVAIATSSSGLRSAGRRAAVLLVVAVLSGVVLSAVLPGRWDAGLAWLLPGIVLSGLGSVLPARRSPAPVVAGLAVGWVGAVVLAWTATGHRFAAFGSTSQAVYLAVASLLGFLLLRRPAWIDAAVRR